MLLKLQQTLYQNLNIQYRSEISVHRIRTLYAHTHIRIRRYADTHTQIRRYAYAHTQIRIRRYADTHTQIRSSLLFIALGFHCVVLLEKTNEISLRENYKTALVDRVVRDLHI